MSDSVKDEIDAFFEQGEKEIDDFLDKVGKEAVELNKTNGNYRNHTGHLRRSNYSEVHDHSLKLGNKASYASKVSSKGYDVIDSGVQYIKKIMESV
jgi:hypothetical protein